MKYKILGRPLTHDEMLEIAKSKEPRLYGIMGDDIIELHVARIIIDLETKQWEFEFKEQNMFEQGEIIFKTRRSALIYLNKKKK